MAITNKDLDTRLKALDKKVDDRFAAMDKKMDKMLKSMKTMISNIGIVHATTLDQGKELVALQTSVLALKRGGNSGVRPLLDVVVED